MDRDASPGNRLRECTRCSITFATTEQLARHTQFHPDRRNPQRIKRRRQHHKRVSSTFLEAALIRLELEARSERSELEARIEHLEFETRIKRLERQLDARTYHKHPGDICQQSDRAAQTDMVSLPRTLLPLNDLGAYAGPPRNEPTSNRPIYPFDQPGCHDDLRQKQSGLYDSYWPPAPEPPTSNTPLDLSDHVKAPNGSCRSLYERSYLPGRNNASDGLTMHDSNAYDVFRRAYDQVTSSRTISRDLGPSSVSETIGLTCDPGQGHLKAPSSPVYHSRHHAFLRGPSSPSRPSPTPAQHTRDDSGHFGYGDRDRNGFRDYSDNGFGYDT